VNLAVHFINAKSSLILYQAALRPDEVNCKVHEMSALNNGSRHGDNPKTS